jgi:hypothetical protein
MCMAEFCPSKTFSESATTMPSFDTVLEPNLVGSAQRRGPGLQGNRHPLRLQGFLGQAVELKRQGAHAVRRQRLPDRPGARHPLAKLTKRSVDVRFLDSSAKIEKIGGDKVKQLIVVKSGIDSETAKKIQTAIKQSKLKVQAAIQGDTRARHRCQARRPAGRDGADPQGRCPTRRCPSTTSGTEHARLAGGNVHGAAGAGRGAKRFDERQPGRQGTAADRRRAAHGRRGRHGVGREGDPRHRQRNGGRGRRQTPDAAVGWRTGQPRRRGQRRRRHADRAGGRPGRPLRHRRQHQRPRRASSSSTPARLSSG